MRPASAKPLIQYSREGGIAGFTDHITIEPDGSGLYTDRSHQYEFKLSAEELKTVNQAMKGAEDAPAPERADHPDAMTTSFRYAGEEKVMPTEVAGLINRIIAEGRESGGSDESEDSGDPGDGKE